jgi:hypothetical protein
MAYDESMQQLLLLHVCSWFRGAWMVAIVDHGFGDRDTPVLYCVHPAHHKHSCGVARPPVGCLAGSDPYPPKPKESPWP